jgi:hypothetical protein
LRINARWPKYVGQHRRGVAGQFVVRTGGKQHGVEAVHASGLAQARRGEEFIRRAIADALRKGVIQLAGAGIGGVLKIQQASVDEERDFLHHAAQRLGAPGALLQLRKRGPVLPGTVQDGLTRGPVDPHLAQGGDDFHLAVVPWGSGSRWEATTRVSLTRRSRSDGQATLLPLTYMSRRNDCTTARSRTVSRSTGSDSLSMIFAMSGGSRLPNCSGSVAEPTQSSLAALAAAIMSDTRRGSQYRLLYSCVR